MMALNTYMCSIITELYIGMGNRDNVGIIYLIAALKHSL